MDLGLCAPGGSHQTVASTKSRTAVLAVLSAVALVALSASLALEQSAGAGTRVTVYNPVAPSGALTATIVRLRTSKGVARAAGRPGGREAGRPSYRCLSTTSRIMDRCFAARRRGPFYCPTNLALPDVVGIKCLPTTPGPLRTAERRSGMPRTGPRRARQEARERPRLGGWAQGIRQARHRPGPRPLRLARAKVDGGREDGDAIGTDSK